MTFAASALHRAEAETRAGVSLDITPFVLDASPRHKIQTVAYNGQVPGPLFRLKQGRDVSVEIRNRSSDAEVVHWHGLFLPSEIDGAMEKALP